MRRLARSRSSAGVFCVFLMKPCTTPMRPSPTKNSVRAIRRPARLLRTSHNPLPSERQSGIPIGQPNWTVARSVPITRRSSAGRLRSHSTTGWLPPAVRKKQPVSRPAAFRSSQTHHGCVSHMIRNRQARWSGKPACPLDRATLRVCYSIGSVSQLTQCGEDVRLWRHLLGLQQPWPGMSPCPLVEPGRLWSQTNQ